MIDGLIKELEQEGVIEHLDIDGNINPGLSEDKAILSMEEAEMDDRFEQFWVFNRVIEKIALFGTTIFIDFFIWEETKDIYSLIQFNLGIFIITPLAVFFASLLSEYLGLKLTTVISRLNQAVFVVLLLVIGKDLVINPLLFGLLAGFVIGLGNTVVDIIQDKIPHLDRLKLNQNINSEALLVGMLIAPLFSNLVVWQGEFTIPFAAAGFVHLSLGLLSLFYTFPQTDGDLDLASVFAFPGNNPEKHILAKVSFLKGIIDSLHFSLIGVLTLSLIGSINDWGWFRMGFNILALALTLTYSLLPFARQMIMTLGLSAVIFFIGSIYLAFNFDLLGIFIYAAAMTVFEVFFGISSNALINQLDEMDVSKQDLTSEYAFFKSVFSSLGMAIPMFILFYIKPDLSHPTAILGLILIVSLVPFTILRVMSKSFYLTHQRP